ncbi:MAG: Hsp20/alpha crystallin family protein [Nitrospinota bacterium]|nr:Hsp20/alpha crystallin family protein [Nitrospinota bacterium]
MNNLISLTPLSLFHSSLDNFFNDESFYRSNLTEDDFLPIDISKSDDEYIIKASLPGCKKKDLDVQVHDNVLTIKSILNENKIDSKYKYIKRERNYSSFNRSLRLPDAVDGDKTNAELKDGVLLITIPLSEKSKPKKINIS